MNPAVENILKLFQFTPVSTGAQFHVQQVRDDAEHLAKTWTNKLPHNAELTVALRKLMEAKDAAVRSIILSEKDG